MQLEERIKSYIAKEILFDESASLDRSASLLESGTIDSTGVMDLVLFLEKEFGIKVADEDLVPDNLDTIERISRYVSGKLAAGKNGAR